MVALARPTKATQAFPALARIILHGSATMSPGLRRFAQALRRRRQVNKPAEQAHQANHAAHCLGPV
jgi:hypothetical protein